MFSLLFGNYLLNNNKISCQELTNVLERKNNTRLKLGVLAIDHNFMTSDQVTHVHQLQKQKDMYFGEIAIEENYITKESVEKLLKMQKSENLLLAQALIDEGIMTMETFESELMNYKKECKLSDDSFEAIKEGNIDGLIEKILSVSHEKDHDYYHKYIKLLYKNFIRFIESEVGIKESTYNKRNHYDIIVQQVIYGESDYYTAIAGNKKTMMKIAGIYAEEVFTELDDYAQDSLGEFLNLHNGLFLVNMSNENVPLDLSVQAIDLDEQLPFSELYEIPFVFPFGEIKLILGKK